MVSRPEDFFLRLCNPDQGLIELTRVQWSGSRHAREKEAGESGGWMRPVWIKKKGRRKGHINKMKFLPGYTLGYWNTESLLHSLSWEWLTSRESISWATVLLHYLSSHPTSTLALFTFPCEGEALSPVLRPFDTFVDLPGDFPYCNSPPSQ